MTQLMLPCLPTHASRSPRLCLHVQASEHACVRVLTRCRWGASAAELGRRLDALPGDALLAAAAVNSLGGFTGALTGCGGSASTPFSEHGAMSAGAQRRCFSCAARAAPTRLHPAPTHRSVPLAAAGRLAGGGVTARHPCEPLPGLRLQPPGCAVQPS
jgi:hypothetical protein